MYCNAEKVVQLIASLTMSTQLIFFCCHIYRLITLLTASSNRQKYPYFPLSRESATCLKSVTWQLARGERKMLLARPDRLVQLSSICDLTTWLNVRYIATARNLFDKVVIIKRETILKFSVSKINPILILTLCFSFVSI